MMLKNDVCNAFFLYCRNEIHVQVRKQSLLILCATNCAASRTYVLALDKSGKSVQVDGMRSPLITVQYASVRDDIDCDRVSTLAKECLITLLLPLRLCDQGYVSSTTKHIFIFCSQDGDTRSYVFASKVILGRVVTVLRAFGVWSGDAHRVTAHSYGHVRMKPLMCEHTTGSDAESLHQIQTHCGTR